MNITIPYAISTDTPVWHVTSAALPVLLLCIGAVLVFLATLAVAVWADWLELVPVGAVAAVVVLALACLAASQDSWSATPHNDWSHTSSKVVHPTADQAYEAGLDVGSDGKAVDRLVRQRLAAYPITVTDNGPITLPDSTNTETGDDQFSATVNEPGKAAVLSQCNLVMAAVKATDRWGRVTDATFALSCRQVGSDGGWAQVQPTKAVAR